MKRKIKIMLLITLLCVSTMNHVLAVTNLGQIEVYKKSDCPRLLKYCGVEIRTSNVVYLLNGKECPAYCINLELPGAGEKGNYYLDTENLLDNEKVWKAIINGYPYKTIQELGVATEEEAYTATKQAVYTMLYDRNIDDYSAVNSEEGIRTLNAYRAIVLSARNSNEIMGNQAEIKLVNLTNQWKVNPDRKEYVYQEYHINSQFTDGFYQIKLQGDIPENTIVTNVQGDILEQFSMTENFRIQIPIQKLTEEKEFEILVDADLKTKPVIYGKSTVPGNQNYALTGLMYDSYHTSNKEKTIKNITKILIHKVEYGTNQPLENVKFQLLDENKNVIFDDLVTNQEGKIELDNLLPGKYYLVEKETLKEYFLYSEEIDISLDFNEEFTVTVNNRKKDDKTEERTFENITVTPSYVKIIQTVKNEETILEKQEETVVKKLPVTGF